MAAGWSSFLDSLTAYLPAAIRLRIAVFRTLVDGVNSSRLGGAVAALKEIVPAESPAPPGSSTGLMAALTAVYYATISSDSEGQAGGGLPFLSDLDMEGPPQDLVGAIVNAKDSLVLAPYLDDTSSTSPINLQPNVNFSDYLTAQGYDDDPQEVPATILLGYLDQFDAV